jgi:hypothetical protein
MNMLNLNLQNNKKVLVLIFCIIMGIVVGYISDKLTNNKLSNSMVLSYLYLKNSENISFDSALLKVPFYYIRRQDKDSLILIKYSRSGDLISFRKGRLSKEEFYKRVNCRLSSLDYVMVNEGEIKIDNEHCYFVTLSVKSNPSEYGVYITIPDKSIYIDFSGEKNDSEKFWEIIKQIKFERKGSDGVRS